MVCLNESVITHWSYSPSVGHQSHNLGALLTPAICDALMSPGRGALCPSCLHIPSEQPRDPYLELKTAQRVGNKSTFKDLPDRKADKCLLVRSHRRGQSVCTASPGWWHWLSDAISSSGDMFLYVDSVVATNESHVYWLQSILRLLLIVEGAAGVSSMARRVRRLVSRGKSSSAFPWDVPGSVASSCDAAMTWESYKTSALRWRAPGSCQLEKSKGRLTSVKQQASDPVKYVHLLPEIHSQDVPPFTPLY